MLTRSPWSALPNAKFAHSHVQRVKGRKAWACNAAPLDGQKKPPDSLENPARDYFGNLDSTMSALDLFLPTPIVETPIEVLQGTLPG
jgi:hypothetical protein